MNVRLRAGLTAALLITTLGLITSPTTAWGGPIFGDIAAGNQIFSGYGMGPGGGANNSIVQGFTMTGTYSLTSVDLYLSQYVPAAGSSFTLSIYSNVGGQPAADLFDLTTSNISSAVGGTPVLVTFTGAGSFTLTTGTTYWLNFYATNPASTTGSTVQWDGALDPGFNQINPSGPAATDLGQLRSVGAGNPPTGTPSRTDLRTAFELNGTAVSSVPEPSSLVMVAIGGLGGVVAARTRRKRIHRD